MTPPRRRERRANSRRLVNRLTTRMDVLTVPEDLTPHTRAEARRLLRRALWVDAEVPPQHGPNRAALRRKRWGPNGGPRP